VCHIDLARGAGDASHGAAALGADGTRPASGAASPALITVTWPVANVVDPERGDVGRAEAPPRGSAGDPSAQQRQQCRYITLTMSVDQYYGSTAYDVDVALVLKRVWPYFVRWMELERIRARHSQAHAEAKRQQARALADASWRALIPSLAANKGSERCTGDHGREGVARAPLGPRSPASPHDCDSTRPPAVVFDVDDCLLSTHPLRRLQFSARLQEWRHRASQQHALNLPPSPPPPFTPEQFLPPIPSVCEFYRRLQALGYTTVILTGRYAQYRDVTLANLRWVGVDDWAEAVFRERGDTHLAAVVYKSKHRIRLARRYRIVGCVGDQWSDLEGPYHGLQVKLPNYFYNIF
jgi:hypothetical protein